MTDELPLLLVVSSQSQDSREPFLQSISAHYRVWLFVGGPGRDAEITWEKPYIAGHTPVDTMDAEACVRAALALDAVHPVAGVMCYDEPRVVTAAEVAQALGLPGSPPEAVARCRDKEATRRALDLAGVPQPRSAAVASAAEALEVADSWGYPVVVKPRNQACGFGVVRVTAPDALPAAWAGAAGIGWPEAPAHPDRAVLVEECVEGPEISVDSAVFDGRVEPLVIAHKYTGFAPAFEEIGHVVDGASGLHDDPVLRDVLLRAHAAVGFHTGATHTELKRTADGYAVIEINARLGGDLVPLLGLLATGLDPHLAAAAVACGTTPDLTRTAHRAAGIRFSYPEQDMRVDSVRIDTSLLPPATVRTDVLADPGQHMELPPRGAAWQSRLAQIVITADSREECWATLGEASRAVIAE